MCAGIIGDACGEVERRTAGEGSGHTARMYVSDESHRGIVPMNHSNKDRTSSAESEGGRPRIKENSFPSDTYTYPTQSGTGRVPRVGECAAGQYAWPLFIRDKNRMRFYEKVIKVKADVAALHIFFRRRCKIPGGVESCQGRRFLAFILTLDSSPRHFIIERGTKRNAVQWSFVP